ncbi:MAG: HD domain-containing protein [Synergistaceae bacterium]|jgi:HD superfamily phosphodiesterase|nr:HD domain-containing protein [Synergistaceae bacterium]
MNKLARLIDTMIEYEKGIPHRVEHFLKVYGYAKAIGELEGLPEDMQCILEAAAIIHEIGIKPSLEETGDSSGKNQERESSSFARKILHNLGFAPEVAGRIVYLIENRHNSKIVKSLDGQILLEADTLVNMHEDEAPLSAIKIAYDEMFATATGKKFLKQLFLKG